MSRDGGYSWPIESRSLQEYEDFAGTYGSNLAPFSHRRWAMMWTERNPDDFARETRVALIDSLGRREGVSVLLDRRPVDDKSGVSQRRLTRIPSRDALVATWTRNLHGVPDTATSATSFGDDLSFGPHQVISLVSSTVSGPVTAALGDAALACYTRTSSSSTSTRPFRGSPGHARIASNRPRARPTGG